jgi:hypothetical protein
MIIFCKFPDKPNFGDTHVEKGKTYMWMSKPGEQLKWTEYTPTPKKK